MPRRWPRRTSGRDGGHRSDIAIEAADIVVMEDDISRCYLAALSKTISVVRQNVATLIVVNCIAALAVVGLVTLWMAVAFGEMGLSLAVIANALRIGRPGG